MPTLHLLHFGPLRDHRGRSSETLTVDAPVSVAELFASLFPALKAMPITYAINQDRVSPDAIPADGDEVVFLPPVGGG